MLMVQVSIPARSSVKVNTNGEKVREMFVDHEGEVLVITGFCGELNENEGVPVCVSLYSFGLSVTEIFTYICSSISYGAGAGRESSYPLILFCRESLLYDELPFRSVILSSGSAGVNVYDHQAPHEHVGQETLILIVPLFTHS